MLHPRTAVNLIKSLRSLKLHNSGAIQARVISKQDGRQHAYSNKIHYYSDRQIIRLSRVIR